MTTVFADAGYWLALWRPRDALHERAMAVAERMGTTAVVTTQLVLTEALNAVAVARATWIVVPSPEAIVPLGGE